MGWAARGSLKRSVGEAAGFGSPGRRRRFPSGQWRGTPNKTAPSSSVFRAEAGGCLVMPHCRLKGVLAEAQEAFFTVLDRYTIHDLVKRNPALLELLAGDSA